MSSSGRVALIYRDRLFFPSERFILNQGESLVRHSAHYVGARAHPAVPAPRGRSTILRSGSPLGVARETLFKVARTIPRPFAELQSLSPILIHAHFGPDGIRATPIARRLGIPLVVTFHGFDATVSDGALRRAASWSMRRYPSKRGALAASPAHFIAVSAFIREKLLAQGFPAERTIVHYIGVDVDRFAPDPCVTRQPIVLFVGRLTAKKGVDDYLRAVAKIQRNRREISAVIVGDGPDRSQLEKLAAELRVHAEFVGFQSPDNVLGWLKRSTVLCAPSKTAPDGDAEGFGLVFAEAQATGLPVVSYASGGVPEAVATGETGFLSHEGDWEDLARNIERLMDDKALATRIGEAGVRRVRSRFNLRVQSRLLDDIYDRVVQDAQ